MFCTAEIRYQVSLNRSRICQFKKLKYYDIMVLKRSYDGMSSDFFLKIMMLVHVVL